MTLNYAASPLAPRKHAPQLDTEWWVGRDGLSWQRPYRGLNALGDTFPDGYNITTGRYGFRTGGSTNQSAGQPSFRDEPSVARSLKQAGYVTGMAGKWRQMGATPGDWGYDEWLTDPTAGGWYWQKTYTKNAQEVTNPNEVYCPDVCFDFAADFFKRHASGQPFFFYYPTHLIHGPILRTPDSKGGNFYEDNVAYLDKQVGRLVGELEKLGLLEKTVVLFTGDNGTARFGADQSEINGRKINGQKGTMLEGGARVPFMVSWKGTAPAGKVVNDLVDFSDFFATFAELGGAKMPEGVVFDSHSFAPQVRGEKGSPREWIFVQLGSNWYVREQGFKLTQSGELLDMSDAPFVEKLVAAGSENDAAKAAKGRLQAVLDQLNPAKGKVPAPGPKKKGPGGKKGRKKFRGSV